MAKTFASINKPTSIVEQLKAGLPPARVRTKTAPEPSLQVQMPPDLIKQLRMAAAERETSVRAVVLQALNDAGFNVGDISDRRRR